MNETETTRLMDKNVNDLTVGDAVKINLGVIAVMAAIPVALYGFTYASERIGDWRMARKERKFKQELES